MCNAIHHTTLSFIPPLYLYTFILLYPNLDIGELTVYSMNTFTSSTVIIMLVHTLFTSHLYALQWEVEKAHILHHFVSASCVSESKECDVQSQNTSPIRCLCQKFRLKTFC